MTKEIMVLVATSEIFREYYVYASETKNKGWLFSFVPTKHENPVLCFCQNLDKKNAPVFRISKNSKNWERIGFVKVSDKIVEIMTLRG